MRDGLATLEALLSLCEARLEEARLAVARAEAARAEKQVATNRARARWEQAQGAVHVERDGLADAVERGVTGAALAASSERRAALEAELGEASGQFARIEAALADAAERFDVVRTELAQALAERDGLRAERERLRAVASRAAEQQADDEAEVVALHQQAARRKR